MIDIVTALKDCESTTSLTIEGRVTAINGPIIKAKLTGAAIGDFVQIQTRIGNESRVVPAKVVSFSDNVVTLSPFNHKPQIQPGALVTANPTATTIQLGSFLLGSIVNCLGEVIRPSNYKNVSPLLPIVTEPMRSSAPNPLERTALIAPLETGVRAIDTLLTIGKGQRLAVLAEPGVGKSTLISMIANNAASDINVIGLVGERGREVLDLIDSGLSTSAQKKTVVVVSTSNEPAVARISAAHTATRIAEYFRDQGLHVLLQIDSLTRLFRAYREVGLGAGEIPIRRGYPPSVFAELPDLIERAGVTTTGSITALYTVLLTSDLDEDPMVDEIKGLTDGHITLRKTLAEKGHYPAIDIVSSLSRIMPRLITKEHLELSRRVIRILSRLTHDRDILTFGGTPDSELKAALSIETRLVEFLCQDSRQAIPFPQSLMELENLVGGY